eukprot:7108388-Pyramimonas_sp.AAC.1
MALRAGPPTAHHQRWLSETGLELEAPGVEMNNIACMVLETPVTYDQEHGTHLAHLVRVALAIQ